MSFFSSTGLQGGQMFFNAVKEGDTVMFASDDEQDRILWVQAMYRATGQSYKPIPAVQAQKLNPKGGTLHADAQLYADRFQKHGMDEFISANPCKLDHAFLFRILQRQTLDHRLNDSYSCLGWFSPGQVFVLDEYCARYGVRGCYRHLCYLTELMEHSENGAVIDPTLLHYSFAFCASHVHGNRPDGIGTISMEEKEKFEEIKERLSSLLENQISHFRYCFPFGRPEGALKATLSLLERVLMKDIATPIPAEEVKKVVRKCLEKAALINYTRLTEYAKIEETMNQATPARKLEEVLHLAELCIEVLQQNEEHHAESTVVQYLYFKLDLQEDNFTDLLAVQHKELTNKDLMELEAQRKDEERQEEEMGVFLRRVFSSLVEPLMPWSASQEVALQEGNYIASPLTTNPGCEDCHPEGWQKAGGDRRLPGGLIYWQSMQRNSGLYSQWIWIPHWKHNHKTPGTVSLFSNCLIISSEMTDITTLCFQV
ncbi:hypothetical protein J1605_009665 [Eschrichtius robustus]|uniref:PH domain-containing protein n=1 Tax=Eschrichtius robustus TaxID=9764 RepID=A0AB34GV75_ESCRO|nr:hypothetical protein J1605_009665 [Eschrichtius robustus]